jgi:hypothetical protein
MPPKFKPLPMPFNLGQYMQTKKKKMNRIEKTKPKAKETQKNKTSSVV